MRIEIIINDQTIMEDIQQEIDNMEEDNEISFKDEQERNEFADDCFEEIAQAYEWRESWMPTWENIWNIVHHMAECRE